MLGRLGVGMFGCLEKFGCLDVGMGCWYVGRYIQHARPAMGRRIIIIVIIILHGMCSCMADFYILMNILMHMSASATFRIIQRRVHMPRFDVGALWLEEDS